MRELTTNSCSWVLGFAKVNVKKERTKIAMKMD